MADVAGCPQYLSFLFCSVIKPKKLARHLSTNKKRLHFPVSPGTKCDHVTNLKPMGYKEKQFAQMFWKVFLKRGSISSLPLSLVFLASMWLSWLKVKQPSYKSGQKSQVIVCRVACQKESGSLKVMEPLFQQKTVYVYLGERNFYLFATVILDFSSVSTLIFFKQLSYIISINTILYYYFIYLIILFSILFIYFPSSLSRMQFKGIQLAYPLQYCKLFTLTITFIVMFVAREAYNQLFQLKCNS